MFWYWHCYSGLAKPTTWDLVQSLTSGDTGSFIWTPALLTPWQVRAGKKEQGSFFHYAPAQENFGGRGAGGGAGLQLLQMEAECHKAGICLFSDTRKEQWRKVIAEHELVTSVFIKCSLLYMAVNGNTLKGSWRNPVFWSSSFSIFHWSHTWINRLAGYREAWVTLQAVMTGTSLPAGRRTCLKWKWTLVLVFKDKEHCSVSSRVCQISVRMK